jgi:hypothetical protein
VPFVPLTFLIRMRNETHLKCMITFSTNRQGQGIFWAHVFDLHLHETGRSKHGTGTCCRHPTGAVRRQPSEGTVGATLGCDETTLTEACSKVNRMGLFELVRRREASTSRDRALRPDAVHACIWYEGGGGGGGGGG